MMRQYHNGVQRLLTALLAMPIFIASIYWSVWTYFILFFFITLFTLLEFYQLTKRGCVAPLKFLGIVYGLCIYVLLFLIVQGFVVPKYLYGLLPGTTLPFVVQLYKKPVQHAFTQISYTLLGVIYIGLPFSMLHWVAFSNGFYNPTLILGLFLMLWANDTGAYCVGYNLGKTKLFKRISPKKSWEGALGGSMLTLMIGYGMAHYFKILTLWEWLVMACVVSIAGIYGDLIASLFKRSIGIKDTGKTFPGHGGLLDRSDSLLIVVPFVVALIKIFLNLNAP